MAAVYDPLNPPGPDNDFHRAVVGAMPLRVLDVGCGTGRFAVELARMGHAVTGADPAAGMLEQPDGGESDRWPEQIDQAGDEQGDARAIRRQGG